MPEDFIKETAAANDSNEPPEGPNILWYLLQRLDSMEGNLRNEIRSTNERMDSMETNLRNEIRATHERIDAINERIDTTNGRITSVITINLAALGVAIAFLSWLLQMK